MILKGFVEQLSAEKGCHEEFELYATVERLAKEVITQNRKIYKGVCANVDFYSGFVYRMLGLPVDLYTPIFAIARIAGWFKDLKKEFKRVVWPDRKKVLNNTLVVLCVVIVGSVLVGLIDTGLLRLMQYLMGLSN